MQLSLSSATSLQHTKDTTTFIAIFNKSSREIRHFGPQQSKKKAVKSWKDCFFMCYCVHSPVFFCCCCGACRLLLILSVICVSMILSCPIHGSLLVDIAPSSHAVVGGPALIILHRGPVLAFYATGHQVQQSPL